VAENVTNDLKALTKRDRANVAIIERFTEQNQILTKRTKDAADLVQELQDELHHLREDLANTRKALKESERVAKGEQQKLREESERMREMEQYRVKLRDEDRKTMYAASML
jgi:SMC interacting uncharacterized protein involved in chromosome segregation